MSRAFFLDGFDADAVRTLRIGSGRDPLVSPIGFRITKGEARTLHTLLAGWLGDYPHDPEGCSHDRCPCRSRKSEEMRP